MSYRRPDLRSGAYSRDDRDDSYRTSAIPLPPSALKRSDLRVSTLGPPPSFQVHRPPSRTGGGDGGGGRIPRQSLFGSASLVSRGPLPGSRLLGQSTSNRGDAFGKTPVKLQHSLAASTMGAGPSNAGGNNRRLTQQQHNTRPPRIGLPPTTVPVKELRDVRGKEWQAKAQRDIYQYLMDIEFDSVLPTLSLKTMKGATNKEFQAIWKRMVEELDPDWASDPKAKFEDEFIQTMKDLRYPHADQISRTSLIALNQPHSWFNMIAILHWMVELARMKTLWILDNINDDPYLEPIDSLNLQSEDAAIHHVLQFAYLSHAYSRFCTNGEDADYTEDDDWLLSQYQAKSAAQLEASEAMQTEIEKRRSHLAELTATPTPLQKAEAELKTIRANEEKLLRMTETNENKTKKLVVAIKTLRQEVQFRENEIKRLTEESEEIQKLLRSQNLTVEQVNTMTKDQETLSKTYDSLKAKRAELQGAQYALDVALTKRTDEVEALIVNYTKQVEEAGLLPSPPEPVKDVNFDITFNAAKSDPKEIVEVDVRGAIKPALMSFRAAAREMRKTKGDEIIDVEGFLEELGAAIDEVKVAIEQSEEELQRTRDLTETLRIKFQEEQEQAKATNAQLERSARDIEDQLANGNYAAEARLKNLQLEFEETKHKCHKAIEDINQKIIAQGSLVADFMSDTSNILKGLDALARSDTSV